MEERLGIFWFRQDLRLNDNLGLTELIKKCDKIIPIFILEDIESLGGASRWWLDHSLESLNNSLVSKNSNLYVFKGEPYNILKKLVEDHNITDVYWNRLYDQYSIKRDTNIINKLNQCCIEVVTFKGLLLNEPCTIKIKAILFLKFLPLFGKHV